MNNSAIKWELAGILVIFILGTIFHFVYNWTGQWKIAALIAPVNESVWEHLKLVLWPTLFFAAVEYKSIGHIVNNFWIAKTAGIITAMVLIVVIFYSYTYFMGHNILVVDILTFLIAVAAGQYISFQILNSKPLPLLINQLALYLLPLLIFAFILFTFTPPHIPVFKNPIDGKYGI